MAGLWTASVGHSRKELAEAAYEQMLELPYYNTFFRTTHLAVVVLSRKLAEIAPDNLNQVFYGSSGSELNDTAIKPDPSLLGAKRRAQAPHHHLAQERLSWLDDRRRLDGRHGHMCMPTPTRSMKASATSWTRIGTANSEDGETPEAFGLRAARALEEEILAVGPENVAAFAGEPVQGAGGVKIAPETYWPEIQRIVDKYGILLLADEVITGFGRLGTWFASQYYGIRPNLISFAKAATSGYIPLSGVMVDYKIVDALMANDDDFNHGYTFSGHPVACAVASRISKSWSRRGWFRASRSSADPRSRRC